ncbi:tRNA 2-selenouridine synthase [Pedobacter cryoconitis]|uniref:tRNA 2-selenouridine synthase n=1 Tax=Pedobacter cryoconitis TaxID=188932 RepID=A0A7W8ZJG4_9SPHI|nr:tRNA 2-selenouridine(34) synthase MnmH [Pedobacter cryoconitis]MBB5635141.1 tRNA 2-selenouridine synthase [Pedobacter cryoconitis]MBB6271675.1 tRNA 2-selenouridine synthase [Pedobacter cryoconitis]
MIRPITINDFICLPEPIPLVDVRTPAEFEKGRIPGAFNIPIFSNEERVLVGTTYKQVGREQAILLGFDLTGSKWSAFIKQALEISPGKKIAVHCWRGGMRSGAMAWALDLYGFEVYLIEGGYKNYRRWSAAQFEKTYQLIILGGMTGSGKTRLLHQLHATGEQVIDLEELAQHQGSSYGTMNKMLQPTQEQFENNLAFQLHKLNPDRLVWVEDESLTIGKRCIPNPFWYQMRSSFLLNLNVPHEHRVELLAREYGALDKNFLIECTERIWKRLGPEQTKNAILAIEEDRMPDFIRIVLVYYDKTYKTGLSKRNKERVVLLDLDDQDIIANAVKIRASVQELNSGK